MKNKSHVPAGISDKMEAFDQVVVIGAGASGMMAAITAAREGAAVRVLEQMKKPGKKLLLTGNGRCNLTNLDPDLPQLYHSVQSADFAGKLAEAVFSAFDVQQTLDFFKSLGLLTQERDGYVYPRSAQAKSVLQVLLAELNRLHVRMNYDTAVTSLEYDPLQQLWLVRTETWVYPAKAVVLACGSKAGIALSSPYHRLAERLGHTCMEPWPALTALHCADEDIKLCEGARTKAEVTLMDAGILPALKDLPGMEELGKKGYPSHEQISRKWGILPENADFEGPADTASPVIGSAAGEIQWTASEISGIPVFSLSRFAYGLSSKSQMILGVDFLPEYKENQVRRYLYSLLQNGRNTGEPAQILNGLVHERAASYLFHKSGLAGERQGNAAPDPEKTAEVFAMLLKRFALVVDRPRAFKQAQIAIGGISLEEVNRDTLESMLCPGLYFSGEVLDIDGPCGGYNLQWAWSSGAAAGKAAAKQVLHLPV